MKKIYFLKSAGKRFIELLVFKKIKVYTQTMLHFVNNDVHAAISWLYTNVSCFFRARHYDIHSFSVLTVFFNFPQFTRDYIFFPKEAKIRDAQLQELATKQAEWSAKVEKAAQLHKSLILELREAFEIHLLAAFESDYLLSLLLLLVLIIFVVITLTNLAKFTVLRKVEVLTYLKALLVIIFFIFAILYTSKHLYTGGGGFWSLNYKFWWFNNREFSFDLNQGGQLDSYVRRPSAITLLIGNMRMVGLLTVPVLLAMIAFFCGTTRWPIYLLNIGLFYAFIWTQRANSNAFTFYSNLYLFWNFCSFYVLDVRRPIPFNPLAFFSSARCPKQMKWEKFWKDGKWIPVLWFYCTLQIITFVITILGLSGNAGGLLALASCTLYLIYFIKESPDAAWDFRAFFLVVKFWVPLYIVSGLIIGNICFYFMLYWSFDYIEMFSRHT